MLRGADRRGHPCPLHRRPGKIHGQGEVTEKLRIFCVCEKTYSLICSYYAGSKGWALCLDRASMLFVCLQFCLSPDACKFLCLYYLIPVEIFWLNLHTDYFSLFLLYNPLQLHIVIIRKISRTCLQCFILKLQTMKNSHFDFDSIPASTGWSLSHATTRKNPEYIGTPPSQPPRTYPAFFQDLSAFEFQFASRAGIQFQRAMKS